jgi:hypothetical protein
MSETTIAGAIPAGRPAPANYKQVMAHFNAKSDGVRGYFPAFPNLVGEYTWDVPVAYVFSRIEAAKHATIYCGIVKLHWTDSELTRELVDKDHMSRGRFRDLFRVVFGQPIDGKLLATLHEAEAIRDRIAHGKKWTDDQARHALRDAFDFAETFNAFTEHVGGFRPFGDLRGFKGRRECLPQDTTRWVLRGMGIPKKEDG